MLLGSGMVSGQEYGGLSARIRLRYIDQVEQRQAIEKQLNRVELANSFTRAVAVGTRKVEAARTPEEQGRFLRMIFIHSPQPWAHFSMLGEYDFSNEKLQNNTGVLPPKSVPKIIPDNRETPNR